MLFIFCVFLIILVSLDSTCTAFKDFGFLYGYEDFAPIPEWLSNVYSKVSNDEYKNGGLNAVALIKIGDVGECIGALISDRHVITSHQCMNTHKYAQVYTGRDLPTSIYFIHNKAKMSTAIEGKTKFTNVSKLF